MGRETQNVPEYRTLEDYEFGQHSADVIDTKG
jgi:hypothetical protein